MPAAAMMLWLFRREHQADEAASVSRAWFYIQKDALDNYMVYSAELSGDGKKRQSEKKKLVVENGNTWKAMHTVKLQS